MTYFDPHNHNPKEGDVSLSSNQLDMYVFHRGGWVMLMGNIDTATILGNAQVEAAVKYDIAFSELHGEDPVLKELWEEYKIMRRLKTGV